MFVDAEYEEYDNDLETLMENESWEDARAEMDSDTDSDTYVWESEE